jgi:hypothetical protein
MTKSCLFTGLELKQFAPVPTVHFECNGCVKYIVLHKQTLAKETVPFEKSSYAYNLLVNSCTVLLYMQLRIS